MKHVHIPFDPTFTIPNHNLDSWNLSKVYESKKIADFEFIRLNDGFSIVNWGSWECAIKEASASDFIGSQAHGDEILVEAKLYIDGEPVSLTTTERLEANTLTFFHHSKLFRSNSLIPVADYFRTYQITSNGVKLIQDIYWLDKMDITDSYLAMLPIKRNLNGNNSLLITDTASRDGGINEDISKPLFNPEFTIGTRFAEAWGNESGIYASVEILDSEGVLDPQFHFSSSPNYNKFYFDFTQHHEVLEGDAWHVSIKYVLDTIN